MSLFLKHEGADDEVENGGLLAPLQSSGKPHQRFAFEVKNSRSLRSMFVLEERPTFEKVNIFMGGTHYSAVQQL